MEQELQEIEETINYFFDLTKHAIQIAKEGKQEENPSFFVDKEKTELTIYDNKKNMVYTVPIHKPKQIKEGQILDLENVMMQYIDTTIQLLYQLDLEKGEQNGTN